MRYSKQGIKSLLSSEIHFNPAGKYQISLEMFRALGHHCIKAQILAGHDTIFLEYSHGDYRSEYLPVVPEILVRDRFPVYPIILIKYFWE